MLKLHIIFSLDFFSLGSIFFINMFCITIFFINMNVLFSLLIYSRVCLQTIKTRMEDSILLDSFSCIDLYDWYFKK